MASISASISANGSRGHHKFTLTVTETGTSETNNTSTISYSFELSPITNGYNWKNWTDASRTVLYTININGTACTGTIPNYDGSSTVTLKSGAQTVPHNTDGTKTLSFSFVVADTANGYNPQTGKYYTPGNASKSGTLALTAFEIEKPVTGSAPIITAYVIDTNSTTSNLMHTNESLVRYHSNAKAVMNVTSPDNAAINLDTLIIRNGSKSGVASKDGDGYSYTFDQVESDTFYFYAEDERGYTAMETVTAVMVDYVKLTCNMGNSRPDASGDMTLTCSGSCFNGYFDETNSLNFNSLTVTYSYTGSGVDTEKYSSYGSGSMIVSRSGNTYSAYDNLSGLDYQATYSFVITATDELETVTSQNSAVKSKPIFHWGENDFTFEVPVIFKGGNANDYGEWTPTLDEYAVASYVGTPKGWYQRVGNVVTIGWILKAAIYEGKNGTELSIIPDSLPYSPAYSAFGGGIAHNIYIKNGGYAFEGWNIGTDKKITARLQPCNNTSAGNLEIASSCCYPYCSFDGEKTVTLAGTICYMTNL